MKRFSALIASLLLLAASLDVWPPRPGPHPPHGRFTADQILDRTEPLCRVLLPSAGRLGMSADLMVAPRPGRRPFRTWVVDCDDAAGRALAHFDWDADTGDLTWASRAMPAILAEAVPPSTRREAINASWSLIQSLGVDRQAHRWRLHDACLPRGSRPDRSWVVCWQADDRRVFVQNGGSGDLSVQVVVRPLRQPAEGRRPADPRGVRGITDR